MGQEGAFDTKIIRMDARDMTIREIQGHLEKIYGIEDSPSLVSADTDAALKEVPTWQNRPLDPCYPVVAMDAIRVNGPTSSVVRLWSEPVLR